MRVFGLNVPNAVSSVRALELSKEAKHRLRIMEWYEAHGKNARFTCRHLGISPDTFYRWKRRFDEGGLVALENASRRPHRVRKATWSPELERAVLELRNLTPGWGKDKLVMLLREEDWRCSTSMVGRILRKLKERGKLVEAPVRDPWHRPRPFKRSYGIRTPKEYRARAPGDIVQIDTADIRPLPGWSFKHFTACDVVTRWHAGHRSGIVVLEAQRAGGEPIKVRGLELLAAVTAEHMAVQAVQQNYDCILGRVRLRWVALCRLGHWPHSISRAARLSLALRDEIQVFTAVEPTIRHPVFG